MTTPIYAFPYPILTDPPNGAAQIQALAEAVETEIDALATSTSSTAATIANPARVQLRTTVVQAVANGTDTAIQFDLEDLDSAGGHSTVTNNSRYTAQVAGLYLFAGGAGFALNSTGNRVIKWQRNGSDISGGTNTFASYTSNSTQLPARTIFIELTVGQYVQLVVTQTSGGALNSLPSTCYMSAVLIRNNAL